MPFSLSGRRINFLGRRKLIITLCVVLSLGVLLQIWVMNRMATFGEQLTRIERTKAQLMLENQILENQIAKMSALSTIKVYAANLGFKPISALISVRPPNIASNH